MLNKVFYPYYPRVQWLYNWNLSNSSDRQCTEITGGWELCLGEPQYSTRAYLKDFNFTTANTGIYFSTDKDNSTSSIYRYYGIATKNLISTARYSKINVNFRSTASTSTAKINGLQFYLTTNKTYPADANNAGNHVGGAAISIATQSQLDINATMQLFTANLPSTASDLKYYLVLMVYYQMLKSATRRWNYLEIYLTK